MIVNNTPAPLLLKDVLLGKITPHLSVTDSVAMKRVCSQWRLVFTENILDEKLYDHVVFDETNWRQVLGIDEVTGREVNPIIKAEYIQKLKRKCDVFNEPDKIKAHRFQETIGHNYFWQTHKVILLPVMINGELVNINKIGKLFSFEKQENNKGTVFEYIYGAETEKYRNLPLTESIFIEVTLDVVPGSRRVEYAEKEAMLKPKSCRVPTPLEALISNVVLNIEPPQKKEEYYFGRGDKLWTYTITNMKLNEWSYMVVGGASASGLPPFISVNFDDVGVMAAAEVL